MFDLHKFDLLKDAPETKRQEAIQKTVEELAKEEGLGSEEAAQISHKLGSILGKVDELGKDEGKVTQAIDNALMEGDDVDRQYLADSLDLMQARLETLAARRPVAARRGSMPLE
ncbi:MAG: hypothetical protein ACYCW6_05305 [Candidatus Xenobia bacterium]